MEASLGKEINHARSIFEDPSKLFDLMDIHGFILKSKKGYEFLYPISSLNTINSL